MKVKCVKNTYKKGWINKTSKRVNLTLGKTYEAEVVLNSCWRDDQAREDHEFLVFNDKKEWSSYPFSMFEPAGDQDV